MALFRDAVAEVPIPLVAAERLKAIEVAGRVVEKISQATQGRLGVLLLLLLLFMYYEGKTENSLSTLWRAAAKANSSLLSLVLSAEALGCEETTLE